MESDTGILNIEDILRAVRRRETIERDWKSLNFQEKAGCSECGKDLKPDESGKLCFNCFDAMWYNGYEG